MMMAFRNVVCALNSLYYFPHSRDFISRHTLHVVILVIPRCQFIWGFAPKKREHENNILINFVRGFISATLLFCYCQLVFRCHKIHIYLRSLYASEDREEKYITHLKLLNRNVGVWHPMDLTFFATMSIEGLQHDD